MYVPGPKRKIYRGDAGHNDPLQKELLASVAGIRPGHIVSEADGEFALGMSTSGAYYIANAPMHGDPLTYVFEEGECVTAYIPRSRDFYCVRAVAATYPSDAALTSNAGGEVRVAVEGDPIVGYAFSHTGADQVIAAGQLLDMRIA